MSGDLGTDHDWDELAGAADTARDDDSLHGLSDSPLKVWLTVREYEFGGERGEEVIAVSATEAVAEKVGSDYKEREREARINARWTGGRTTGIDVAEWVVAGV